MLVKFILIVSFILFIIILFQYMRTKDLKKLLISLGTSGIIMVLFVLGNMTKTVFLLFLLHKLLMIASLGALFLYIKNSTYYWWIIFSPLVSIILAIVLEYFIGSANEVETMRQVSLSF
ncbi:MAG: hypothetical protein U9O64_08175 [Campylobacterota bacterium]|nr:hypothetical protein [Campylobacterota bacterium]